MHDHKHHHSDSAERISWAFFLNVIFTIVEFIGGWLTNSTAIMADAVHDLGDSLSIGTAWVLDKLSMRKPDNRFSYGYQRLSLLGALINGLVLFVGSAWILSEAIPRLYSPEMPVVEGMMGLAVLGMLVNGFAAFKLSKGSSMNERVLNWHLIEDVLGWVAVFLVSLVLMFIKLPILDPLLSILFTMFIAFNVGKNVFATVKIFLQAVPDLNKQEEIGDLLSKLPGISEVHHLHLWSLDGERDVLTAHLVLADSEGIDSMRRIKREVNALLKGFSLEHTTIEIEFMEEGCRDSRQH